MTTFSTVAPEGDVGSDARFAAVLYPSRSLPPAGFACLMIAVITVSVAIGAAFILAGAWPVSGFLGLDVLLLYLAFRWNYREGRRAEFVRLDRDGLILRKLDAAGRSAEWRFDPYWVQVRTDPASKRLFLRSHGQQIGLGDFLVPEERLEVAEALGRALKEHRAPAST